MKKILLLISLAFTTNQVLAQEQKLNVIVFGAHPDDCDIDAGGTAILYSFHLPTGMLVTMKKEVVNWLKLELLRLRKLGRGLA
jgi:spermidine/putrescine-binding protein